VNRNFGCGSSREHAPQAIQRWGIRAVVGEGYSEIFFGNAVQMGLPCLTIRPDETERLMTLVEKAPDTIVTVDLDSMHVDAGAFKIPATLPSAARDALRSGMWDGTGLLLEDFDAVRATAAKLPYVTEWA
jgi:3-isopropylmalate/(R)-2-methylmalate dehydratase small subunit